MIWTTVVALLLLLAVTVPAQAQLTFDPATPPTNAAPPAVEYNEFSGTFSHQKGPKTLMVIHVDTADKPWTSGIYTEASYVSTFNSLSQRYYDSAGHQTWVGDKREGGLTIPRVCVTPVVRLPNPASYYTDDTFWNLFQHAIAAVHALGGEYAVGGRLDPDKFDRVMVNSGSFKAISSTGLAYVGGRYSWPGGAYEHELGHNWGVYHANFWQRPAGSVLPRDLNGSSTEYGDGADIMGGGNTLFTVLFKEELGFIESARGEVLAVTNSGTYRLYAHTQGFARNDINKVRALKLQLTGGGSPAYLGFRYESSGATAGGDSRNSRDRNAVQFHWNVGGANFIDTTPNSRTDDDKIDGSIKLGRTYSEPAASQDVTHNYGGLHITPIARGATVFGDKTNQYVDVVINRGDGVSASNQAPVAAFPSNPIPGTAGTPLALALDAADPDGDTLAYDWDFGNGGYNTANSATQSVTYATAGLYLVRCTVSDLKGRTTSAYAWANIGNQPTRDADTVTTVAGLHYRTYRGTWSILPSFDQLQPVASGTCSGFDLAVKPDNDNFAILYTGYIDVPADDLYQFTIKADDGARLVIGSTSVVMNDGVKSTAQTAVGNISLKAGKHPLRLEFFHKDGAETLEVQWWRIGQALAGVPTACLVQDDWADNLAPTVSITAPAASNSFIVNSDVAITAGASDDGTLAKVVFFANGAFLAEDTAAPYQTVWPRVPVGNQTLTAIAHDTTGRWTRSAPVTFAVVSPAPANGLGINFGANAVEKTLSFNEKAGAVYAYANWNNVASVSGAVTAVTDHSGNSTSARLVFQGNDPANGSRSGVFNNNADTASANGKLMRAGVYRDYDLETGAEPNPYATVSGVPYAAYDVYVYFDGLETWDADAQVQRFVLTPTEGPMPAPRYGRNSLVKSDGVGDYPTYDSWTGFREATALATNSPVDQLAGNYTVFRNQAAPGFKLEATRSNGTSVTNGTSGRQRRFFNALQIMEATPVTPALVIRETDGSTAVSEAGLADSVAVALAVAPTGAVTVTITPDAQLQVDKASLTFTPDAWSQSQSLTVRAVDDGLGEGSHTGKVALVASGANYGGTAVRTLGVLVADNDLPSVSVSGLGTALEGDSPTARSFRFARSGAASCAGALTVNFAMGGTADKAADYTLSGASCAYDGAAGTGSVVIAEGGARAVLTLTPVNDSAQEGLEKAILTVTPGTGYAVGAASAVLAIQDDDRVDTFCQYFGTSYPDYGLDEYPIDLVGKTLVFLPNGSPSFYAATVTTGVTSYPTPISGHTSLRNTAMAAGDLNSGWWAVTNPTVFYGATNSVVYVSTEGGVTFGSGESVSYKVPGTHFNRKRVALFWYYLGIGSDAGNTGDIYVGRIAAAGQERTVVTYDNVPYAYSGSYTKLRAQVEFWDNGRLTLTWLQAANNLGAMVGLSNLELPYNDATGSYGPPDGFQESNLSDYGPAPTNGAPSFATVPTLAASAGTVYSYALAVTDADGDAVTITAPAKPDWLALTDGVNGTASLAGTPPSAGTVNVTLRASDGVASTDQSFTLTIAPAGGNTPPAFISSPGATPLANAGQPYSYTLTATDSDGQALVIRAVQRPSWLTLTDNGDGTAVLAGVAPDSELASHPVSLLVSDGAAGAVQSFVITVNRPPVIALAGPAGGVVEMPDRRDTLVLTASVTDDGLPAAPGAVTTAWAQVSGPGGPGAVFGSATAAATTVTFPVSGVYVLRLLAHDGAASNTQTVSVYVETDAEGSLPNGLRAHWKFDEAAGTTAADSTTNARTLAIAGAVTFAAGVAGNAYNGSASDTQYGESAAVIQPTQMTFSAWINSAVSPGDGGNERNVLCFLGGANQRAELFLPSGSSRLRFRSSHATQGLWEATDDRLPANEWVHVAVTYDQSSTANHPVLYLNGQVVALTRVTAPGGSVNATDKIRIGGSGGNLNQAWKGRVDEVRLYDRILSANEVSLLPLTTVVNQAPAVSAALRDPLAGSSNAGTLAGTATDDGLPAGTALATAWSLVSGPGPVTFGDVAALDSTVTFSAPGDYTLRLSATDGAATVLQDMLVTVTGGFAVWMAGYPSLTGADALETADPDGDGMPNGAEYVAGTVPTNAASVLRVEATLGPVGEVALRFEGVNGRIYAVVYTNALAGTVGDWPVLTNDVPGTNGPVVIGDPASGGATRRFYRVRVAQP